MINNSRFPLVAGAIGWIVLYVLILNGWMNVSLGLSIWDSAVSNITVFAASFLLATTIRDYLPSMGKLWISLGLAVLLAFVCQWIAQYGLSQIGDEDAVYNQFLVDSAPIRTMINFLIIGSIATAAYFYYQLVEQKEIARREATTASMVKEAELQKLQLQLQPHFLFNCLNSINALILVQPQEATRMVQRLSDFLRTTLKRADEHWISLEAEWQYLQSYLDIEKVRFGHRLEVEASFAAESMSWKIPALLLQPLVENAIKFGLYGTTGEVIIKLETQVTGSMMVMRISNPFESDMQPPKGSGFGLSGLKRRLYLLFARNDLMETEVSESNFAVILKIPRQL